MSINLVVFASGSGTTLQAIIDAISNKKLNAKINLVVSNKPDAYALKRAEMANIPTYIIKSKSNKNIDEELFVMFKNYKIDLIVLAGYLRIIGEKLLENYTIINTHPSLLPKYGGKGMHGMYIHTAVIEAKEKESGVTVHFLNKEYDKGSIIKQTKVNVLKTDTPETLSAKVQIAEKIQLIEVLNAFEKGQIK